MKFCRLGKEQLINLEKFEKIKDSIFLLFGAKDHSLEMIYKNSLKLLFEKVKDPSIPLDWSSPMEIECLKELELLNYDNTIDKDVQLIVNYLVGIDNDNKFTILDKPLFEVEL